MDQNKPAGRIMRGPVPFAGERNEDYRARIAAYQAEAAERRQQELLEQRSSMTPPASRIRIWERLHQVELPRNPSHRLLDVIAAQTGLTSDDVRDEQRLRARPVEPSDLTPPSTAVEGETSAGERPVPAKPAI